MLASSTNTTSRAYLSPSQITKEVCLLIWDRDSNIAQTLAQSFEKIEVSQKSKSKSKSGTKTVVIIARDSAELEKFLKAQAFVQNQPILDDEEEAYLKQKFLEENSEDLKDFFKNSIPDLDMNGSISSRI